jgi:serine/threonine-protein phosphatase 2B catalytic subunit
MESYEVLLDPLGDRKVKELPLPPIKPLADDQLF